MGDFFFLIMGDFNFLFYLAIVSRFSTVNVLIFQQ